MGEVERVSPGSQGVWEQVDIYIDDAAEGDLAAFTEIVKLVQRPIRNYIYRLGGPNLRRHTDDIVQDTFIRAWKALPQLRDRTAFKTWCFAIATNVLLSRARLDAPIVLKDRVEVASDSTDDAIIDHCDLRNALTQLPSDQAAVISLRFEGDLTRAEIADLLGIPIGTVDSRTGRAVATLRQLLQLAEGK